MIRRRYGQQRRRAQALVVDQRFEFAGKHHLFCFRFELNSPIVWILDMPAPRVGMKVVDQIPTAYDQNALFPERCKFSADFEVEQGRSCIVDAQLDDGNIGFRIHMAKDRPGAVIETPRIIEIDLQGCEQMLDTASKQGIARSRILHAEQLLWESTKIVNGSWRRGYGYAGLWHEPMS